VEVPQGSWCDASSGAKKKRTPSTTINVTIQQQSIKHPKPFQSGINARYQSEMDKRYSSGISNHSLSTSSEGRQRPTRAGKSNRAVPSLNTGDSLGKERDGEQEEGFDVSNYSPREYYPGTSGYLDSGEERFHSPTSPRYSRPGSCHAVPNYSPCEECYDGTSDHALRKARRSAKRQGSSETDTTDGFMGMQPANEKIIKNLATRETPSTHPDEAVDIQPDGGLKG